MARWSVFLGEARAAPTAERYRWLLAGSETLTKLAGVMGTFALPFVAVLTLDGSPVQVGLIAMVLSLPALLVGPMVGALSDRLRCKPILLGCSLSRITALAAVPVLALSGGLSITTLMVVAVMLGASEALFRPAYRAYLVRTFGQANLLSTNLLVAKGIAVAEACGLVIAGFLVSGLGAPAAILCAALSCCLATAITAILPLDGRPGRVATGGGSGLVAEIAAGWSCLRRMPGVRLLLAVEAVAMLGVGTAGAAWVIHVTKTLAVAPGVQGGIYAVGGLCSVMATMVAGKILRRMRLGRIVAADHAIGSLNTLAVALVPAVAPWPAAVVTLQQLTTDPLTTVRAVGEVSYRQLVVPMEFIARVESVFVAAVIGANCLGQVLGGLVAEAAGTRTAIGLATVIGLSASALAMANPVRRAMIPTAQTD